MLVWIAIVFFGAAALLFFIYGRRRAALSGEIIYSDVASADAMVLICRRYALKGSLMRSFLDSGDLIPIERKKTRAPHRP